MRMIAIIAMLTMAAGLATADDAIYCGCPTPWVVLSGPVAGKVEHFYQIDGVSQAELDEMAAYNKIACVFDHPIYPWYTTSCNGIAMARGVKGLMVSRFEWPLLDKTVTLYEVAVEMDFPVGMRMASVVVDARHVQCAAPPPQPTMLQETFYSLTTKSFGKPGKAARLCNLTKPSNS